MLLRAVALSAAALLPHAGEPDRLPELPPTIRAARGSVCQKGEPHTVMLRSELCRDRHWLPQRGPALAPSQQVRLTLARCEVEGGFAVHSPEAALQHPWMEGQRPVPPC